MAWFGDSNQSVASTPSLQASTSLGRSPARYESWNGSKYPGGLSSPRLLVPDQWSIRAKSSELFERNLYARGAVRRLVTAEISTGLHLEAVPNEQLLGVQEDALADWSEDIENRFALWGKDPFLCDLSEISTFGQLQAQARLEALVAGDVLVTLTVSGTTRIPRIRLISGDSVQTPFGAKPKDGNRIEDGVELDSLGRHVAFHVRQRDGSFRRLPAWGEKSGRRLAWLVYGSDKRNHQVRGTPLLALIMQSLEELDNYRDAATRKALLNSYLSLWVEKTQEKASSLALGAAGLDNSSLLVGSSSGGPAGPTEAREFRSEGFVPGLVVEELQTGERLHAHGANGTDEKFADFEAAIVQGIAWALEIPPEVLRLSFDSNYSASKAANNEFEAYLYKARNWFGEQFCSPIFIEWLLSETLAGNVQATGLLDSWRNPSQYVTFGAWTASEWTGHVKPTVDPVKQISGYELMFANGLMSRDRACRETSGMKFTRVAKQMRRENEALARALEPLTRIDPKVLQAAQNAKLHVIPDEPEDSNEDPKESNA